MESVSVDRQQRSIYYLSLLLAEKSPIMESKLRDIFFLQNPLIFIPTFYVLVSMKRYSGLVNLDKFLFFNKKNLTLSLA